MNPNKNKIIMLYPANSADLVLEIGVACIGVLLPLIVGLDTLSGISSDGVGSVLGLAMSLLFFSGAARWSASCIGAGLRRGISYGWTWNAACCCTGDGIGNGRCGRNIRFRYLRRWRRRRCGTTTAVITGACGWSRRTGKTIWCWKKISHRTRVRCKGWTISKAISPAPRVWPNALSSTRKSARKKKRRQICPNCAYRRKHCRCGGRQ